MAAAVAAACCSVLRLSLPRPGLLSRGLYYYRSLLLNKLYLNLQPDSFEVLSLFKTLFRLKISFHHQF